MPEAGTGRSETGWSLHPGDSLIIASQKSGKRKFYVELIKPSHYDDNGYVIQWVKSWLPSNSLACLNGIACDSAERQALGEDIEIVVNAYDESNTVIPIKKIKRRIQEEDGRGLICMVGVQSNQFPRAVDLCRQFISAGLPTMIGGFHVSGCLAMLPEMPADLNEAQDLGISFFAGEVEGRFDMLLEHAMENRIEPIYNYLNQLPDLRGAVTPHLPTEMVEKYVGTFAGLDTGRGCPFQCSFCTIINVQGRKSRFRSVEDVEHMIRHGLSQGITRYFITDDNFARNRNWEPILDCLAMIREERDGDLGFQIQVDTQSHTLPRFVEKCVKAGVTKVFIGMESVDPENLAAANKKQNKIGNYRDMALAWRDAGAITYAGYIVGFPADTPERVTKSVELIKRELSIDFLEFLILTPLPGSEDHKQLVLKGVEMDPDMNKYDTEHVTTAHPNMTKDVWEKTYFAAWDSYYSDEHVEKMMRRASIQTDNPKKQTMRILYHVAQFYGTMLFERIHPLQAGYFRRKLRTQRRYGLPRENPVIFYPRRVWETVRTYLPLAPFVWKYFRMRKRILNDPNMLDYTDESIARTKPEEQEDPRILSTHQAHGAVAAPKTAESESPQRKAV